MKLSSSRCGCGAIYQPTIRAQRACTACTVRKHQAAANLAMDLRVNEVPSEADDVHGFDACGSGDQYLDQDAIEADIIGEYIEYRVWDGHKLAEAVHGPDLPFFHDDLLDAMVFGPQLDLIQERLKKYDKKLLEPRPVVWVEADATSILEDIKRVVAMPDGPMVPSRPDLFPPGFLYTIDDLREATKK
jgi:hypothetical protein